MINVNIDPLRSTPGGKYVSWDGRRYDPIPRFVYGDATDLPFARGTVDFVVVEGPAEFGVRKKFVEELRRVLKSDGARTVPNHYIAQGPKGGALLSVYAAEKGFDKTMRPNFQEVFKVDPVKGRNDLGLPGMRFFVYPQLP